MEMQSHTTSAKSFVKNHKLLVGGAALATGLLVTGKWKPVLGTLGIRTSEEPSYDVVEKEGKYELRSYPASLIARTVVSGDFDSASTKAFRSLFAFLDRGNESGEKLDMTVPVYLARVMRGQDAAWMMSFFVPDEFSLQTLPKPKSSDIEIHLLPERQVAAYRFSGDRDEKAFNRASEHLRKWTKRRGLEIAGEPILALYDQPMTLPFRRRNEVQIFLG